jgi:peptide deformylase
MKRKIITYPNSVLTKEAEKVKNAKEEAELIKEMKEILKEEDGAGLAAPQIGISKQIFVVRDHDHYYAFMNPKITEKSEEKITANEGCLSFPGLWIDVERSKKIKVEALNENDERIVLEAEGVGAVVFQHEIDHLMGVVFIDHLSFFKKIAARIRYFLKNLL